VRDTYTEMRETRTEILARQSAMEDMLRQILGRLPPPIFLCFVLIMTCIFDKHCVLFWIFYVLHNVLLICHFDVTDSVFVLILLFGM
jgi:hypothetical protein